MHLCFLYALLFLLFVTIERIVVIRENADRLEIMWLQSVTGNISTRGYMIRSASMRMNNVHRFFRSGCVSMPSSYFFPANSMAQDQMP